MWFRIYALASGQDAAVATTPYSCIASFVNSGLNVAYCFECEVGR